MKKFQTKKSLGQHFLKSETVPIWMANTADIKRGDIVLEIGPGTGVLTKVLLSRGARVVALEADRRAIDVLQNTFKNETQNGQLTLHHMDVRDIDMHILGLKDQKYKVVSNIPYYLTGHLFRTILESASQPTYIVFLVQREIAQRIARTKKESLLSLSVKAYGTPSYVKTVGKSHFKPQPNVDSAIIRISDISRKNFKTINQTLFFTILRVGFGSKRKQLLGNLSKMYEREVLMHIFSTLKLSPSIRAEDVSLQKWLSLVKELSFHTTST